MPDGRLVLADLAGRVSFVSPGGEVVSSFDQGKKLVDAPLVDGAGNVFVRSFNDRLGDGNDPDNVLAYGPDGVKRWSLTPGRGGGFAMAIDGQGRLLTASHEESGSRLLLLE
ncbi:MAG: hypothetical protein EOO75_19360 [Myxococcales bacterium]|nr:MAG: hypothetical protein EOO75_19360 [Myxococcales bacterium]